MTQSWHSCKSIKTRFLLNRYRLSLSASRYPLIVIGWLDAVVRLDCFPDRQVVTVCHTSTYLCSIYFKKIL
jgi:hypothetical protein